MRHAKSSWERADLSDFERPLNERGRHAAPLIGQFIVENQLQPDIVLSSPAKRAEQTARIVRQTAQIQSQIIFNAYIYEAVPGRLLDVLSEQEDTNTSILLVGHNPGIEGLIKILTGESPQVPTASLAVVDLEIGRWRDIATAGGSCECSFVQRNSAAISFRKFKFDRLRFHLD